MKTIPNKRTTIEKESTNEAGGIEFVNYGSLINSVIKQVKPDGLTIGEMKLCFNIIDTVEKSDGEINLEDEQFEYLKHKIPSTKWIVLHKDIIAFEDDINAIK